MDMLSSQATVAGYKAVLLGASTLPRLLPMMTTAAGSLTPGKAFVLGAGATTLISHASGRKDHDQAVFRHFPATGPHRASDFRAELY